MKLTYYTTVTNGKLSRTWQQAVDSFEGKRVEVTIQKAKKKRTTPQNAYYWGVVIPILQQGLADVGYLYNKDATHELIKRHVAETEPGAIVEEIVIEKTGEVLSRIRSTSELSTSEFMDYLEIIKQFASESLGVYIPEPNENLKLDL